MQPTSPTPASIREQRLWQVARARVKFQSHALVFVLVNAGLWLLWALLPESHSRHELPWPIWTSLFWGFGLALQGFAAYSRLNCGERTQREYERLLTESH
ncbi:2TM domain-containing protein [Hymenobacter psoromatis]|uniref:2TM domain-containing protein n=1 Tax=Hymenobacter psoromatis TaxID=1484116 RepID=UPI001CBD8DB8|nr:2TM domain-containing protein [Hymenobacter psoromatis]